MALVWDILTDTYVDDVTGQRITAEQMAMNQHSQQNYHIALQQAQQAQHNTFGLANMFGNLGINIGMPTSMGTGLNPYAQAQPYLPAPPQHLMPGEKKPETMRQWLDRRVQETMWVPA